MAILQFTRKYLEWKLLFVVNKNPTLSFLFLLTDRTSQMETLVKINLFHQHTPFHQKMDHLVHYFFHCPKPPLQVELESWKFQKFIFDTWRANSENLSVIESRESGQNEGQSRLNFVKISFFFKICGPFGNKFGGKG